MSALLKPLRTSCSYSSFTTALRVFGLKFVCVVLLILTESPTVFGQIVLLSPTGDGGFETGATFAANGWTAVNANRSSWEVGAGAVSFAGARGVYTIDNTAGTWAYLTTGARASHFYRDIAIPAGATNIVLSFYWKGRGETNWDRALVYTAPTTVTPAANAPVSNATAIAGATLVWTQPIVQPIATAYTLATIVLPNALAGTTVRLIFTWQNDASGGVAPGAAIDNISLTYFPPCAGVPNAGTAAISAASGCASANFTLSASGLTEGTGITYQWQSAPSATGPWSNIAGANASNFITTTAATTYYRLVTTCTNSGASANTNTVVYTVIGGNCACAAYPLNFATSTADEDITNVTVGAMNNSSICGAVAPGAGSVAFRYSNYTGSVAGPSGVQGAVVPFSLSMTTCGGIYSNFFQIYVDWNQDGDFADAGEQAYSQAASVIGNQTAVGNITVPPTATVGTTRMRVVNIEATASTTNYASVAYTYGETEDYCFTVTAAAACAGVPNVGLAAISSPIGCPSVNFDLSASGLSFGTGITYQWQSSPTGLAGSWVNIAGATSAAFTTSATATTYYRLVTTCSNGGATSVTNTVSYVINCNDLICDATPIACGQTLAGTTIGATLTGTGEVANGCGGTATQPGVWYSVAGNGQIMTASLCGTATWDSRIQIFSGANCNTITCVGGNDDGGPACAGGPASFQWTSVVGVNYYIFVSGFFSSSAFSLALTCAAPPPPPANDLICNATLVTCGQSVNGTTVNATPNGTGEGQTCGGFTQNQPGVWYSIVGSGSNINASLCGTAWDSRIQVFTGANCNTVNCVGGNDNNGPLCAGNAASFSWLAVNGQTYYILVSGATAATSTFTLSMACQTPCTASCNGGPPPANDACGGAQNLGAIPTPAACPNGVGAPVNLNTTNVCATAEPNYTSLLGCQPAGNQAAPAADVWYRFTIVAPVLNITINGLGTPNIALYEGANCANLIPRGCAIGSVGFLNAQFQGLAAGTYYLQVSGGDVLDQCTFTMTLQNNYDCAGCVLAAVLDVTPPPINGQYQPGTTVTFCYTINSYQQTSANWLHGVIPTFGPGWNLSTFTPLPTNTVTNGVAAPRCTDSGIGTWSWYNTNVTSSANGGVTGPGFYFETSAGGPGIDGNPGNNFGDYNPGSGTNPTNDDCAWTFCWTIQTNPITSCVQDQSLNVLINTTGDGESGSWNSLGCTQDPSPNFFAQFNCCPTPNVTITNQTCASQNNGTATGQGLGTGPWSYVWLNSAGATLQTNPNVSGTSLISNLAPGDYILQVTDAAACVSNVAFTILPAPTLTASIASPATAICSGSAGTVNFTGTPGAIVSYNINGGAAQTITLSAAGTASVTTAALISATTYALINVSTGGAPPCVVNVSGNVAFTIQPNPTANLSVVSPICSGQTSALTFTGTAGATVNYTAGGTPQTVVIGAGGTTTINSAALTANTTFALVNVISAGAAPCTTAVALVGVVTVTALPTATLTSSTSLCPGSASTINFTGTANATLAWTTSTGGSGTFVINATGVANIGPSSVGLGATWPAGAVITFNQVTISGCPAPINFVVSVTSNINVTVVAQTPICSGQTAQLTFTGSPSATVTYNLGGANLITNTDATGTVVVTTPVLTANTTVTVTLAQIAGGCSQVLANAAAIVVNPAITPTFNAIGPFCLNANAPALPATSNQGVSGTWSPSVINTTTAGTVNYTFTPVAGSCPATPVVVPIIVNDIPSVYAFGVNPTCSTACNGSATVDIVGGTSPYNVIWSNGQSGQSIASLCVGTYSATVTDANGCVSSPAIIPPGCFQIESILVDACGTAGGNPENINEMVFFQVGSAPLTAAGLTVSWPTTTNPWLGLCTNQAFIDNVNATITGGGQLVAAPAVLPAGANVVLITGNTATTSINSFANITGTLYVLFQCSPAITMTAGYFGNLPTPLSSAPARILTMNFGTGCNDQVTYDVNTVGPNDGASVYFTNGGTPTYVDHDCVVPSNIQSSSITLTAPTPVLPTFAPVGPYCSGSAIPALPTSSTNIPTAVTGTWLPALSNTATTTYTFTPTPGLCANTATLTVNITPLNTAGTPSSSPTICINTALTPITIVTTGATGIGTPAGLPAGVTALWAANVITISGIPTVAGPFSYTIPLTGGCGTVNATGIITVNPLNTAGTPSSSPTLCINTTLTPITIATTGATGIGTPTGLPAGVTASWAGNVITIVGTPTASGTFNYSIPLTGGCGTVNATGTITVSAPAIVTLSYGGPFCPALNSVPPINSWTGGGTYGVVPAGLDLHAGTGLIALNTSTPGSYTVTFTPTGCASVAQAIVVINDVLDFVNLQFPQSGTICATGSFNAFGQVYNDGLITTVPAGPAAGVTVQIGYSTSNNNPATWTNWTNASFNTQAGNNDEYIGTLSGLAAGTYYYAFRYQINGCAWQYGGYSATGGGIWGGANVNGVLTVDGLPNAGGDGAVSVCVSGTPVALFNSLIGSPANTGSWTGPSSLDNGSQGTYDPLTDNPGAYTYTVQSVLNICPADVAIVTVTETLSPQASIAYASPICASVTSIQSPIVVGAPGGTFSALPAGLGITASGTFNPTTATPGTYTVTYSVAATNGCAAFQTQASVIIQAAPTIPTLAPANPCAIRDSVFTAGGGSWYEFFVNGVSVGPASAVGVLDTTALAGGSQVCVRSYPAPPIMDGNLTDPSWTPVILGTTGGPASQAPFTVADTRLDGLKMLNRNGRLYIAVAGNEIDGTLQIENNRILLFIDSKPGGYNTLSTWVNRSNAGSTFTDGIRNLDGGIQFDAGFEADYILSINRANLIGSTTFYDLYDMVANTNSYLGSSPGAQFGYQESFTDNDLTRGFELYVPLASIGNPTSLKVFGMLINDPGANAATLVSNQLFTVANAGDNNYGNGAISFPNAAPNAIVYQVTQDCFEETCVTVSPSVTPTFTALAPICQGDPAPTLPTSSTNVPPVTGTWTGPVSNQASGTYTFTPAAGQCAGGAQIGVVVNPTPATDGIYHD